MTCDHNWQPGDIYSDWICSECGERADIPEYEDDEHENEHSDDIKE